MASRPPATSAVVPSSAFFMFSLSRGSELRYARRTVIGRFEGSKPEPANKPPPPRTDDAACNHRLAIRVKKPKGFDAILSKGVSIRQQIWAIDFLADCRWFS